MWDVVQKTATVEYIYSILTKLIMLEKLRHRKGELAVEQDEVQELPPLPSSKLVKMKITKILKSRDSMEKKYDAFLILVRDTFIAYLRSKKYDLIDKELSYEEIKQELLALPDKDRQDIDLDTAVSFLDRIIEISYAPYEYSQDKTEKDKEVSEVLGSVAKQFHEMLW